MPQPAATTHDRPPVPTWISADATAGTLAQRAARRRAFLAVLSVPCPRHHALAGEPCFVIPDEGGGHEAEAICPPRAATAQRSVRA